MGRCIFKEEWLHDDKYKMWLKRFKDNEKRAECKWCSKDFSISSMGEAALKSHVKSDKHMLMARLKTNNGLIPFKTVGSSSSSLDKQGDLTHPTADISSSSTGGGRYVP